MCCAPHTDHIASTLPGIEQEGQRQPGARAYCMVPLELSDLVIGPTMMARGSNAYGPHLPRRIVGAQSDVDRMLHQNAERHAQTVGGARLLCPCCHQLDDMITPQVCRSLVAMILTETFDDPAIGALR